MPLKINSTGGGSVTLDPINTGTAFTISLPAETGTVFTTTSNLTSTAFTGRLPFANLPTGSILQVVQGSTSTTATSTALSFVDTNLSATITPKYSTSNILVLVNQQCNYSAAGAEGMGVNLLRGASIIHASISNTTGPFDIYSGTTNIYSRHTITCLDSPASTSALTYKTQMRPYSSGSVTAQGTASPTNGKSYIILMEIAG